MATNREKNQAYDQRQQSAKRPAPGTYNFADLEAVVRAWVAPRAEDLSPFATCNS
jgi:hypothetical protein